MTAKAFCDFLERMAWSDRTATEKLGVGSRHTLAKWKQDGAPLYIGYACAAIVRGLAPWPD